MPYQQNSRFFSLRIAKFAIFRARSKKYAIFLYWINGFRGLSDRDHKSIQQNWDFSCMINEMYGFLRLMKKNRDFSVSEWRNLPFFLHLISNIQEFSC